jgi:hypothetical protein
LPPPPLPPLLLRTPPLPPLPLPPLRGVLHMEHVVAPGSSFMNVQPVQDHEPSAPLPRPASPLARECPPRPPRLPRLPCDGDAVSCSGAGSRAGGAASEIITGVREDEAATLLSTCRSSASAGASRGRYCENLTWNSRPSPSGDRRH